MNNFPSSTAIRYLQSTTAEEVLAKEQKSFEASSVNYANNSLWNASDANSTDQKSSDVPFYFATMQEAHKKDSPMFDHIIPVIDSRGESFHNVPPGKANETNESSFGFQAEPFSVTALIKKETVKKLPVSRETSVNVFEVSNARQAEALIEDSMMVDLQPNYFQSLNESAIETNVEGLMKPHDVFLHSAFNEGKTDTDSSNFHPDITYDVFKVPPAKKSRKEENFSPEPRELLFENSCEMLKTEYLFGNSSISISAFEKQGHTRFKEISVDSSTEVPAETSCSRFEKSSDVKTTRDETKCSTESEPFLQYQSQALVGKSLASKNLSDSVISDSLTRESFISESMVPKRCREKILEKSFLNKEKFKINTFYKTRVVMQTSQTVIDDFYKVQRFQDWNSIVEDMVQVMEPSLDYLHSRLELDNVVVLGNMEQEIGEDDHMDCEDIRESIEEISKSFENPNESLTSSTPNKSMNKSRSHCASSQKISQRNKICTDESAKKLQLSQNKTRHSQASKLGNSVASEIPFNISNMNLGDFMTMGSVCEINPPLINETQGQGQPEGDITNIEEDMLPLFLEGFHTEEALATMSQQKPLVAEARREAIISQIENINLTLLESLVNQKPMILKVRKVKSWNDCELNNEVLSQKEDLITTKSINFSNKNSERTFTITIVITCEIYSMLMRNLTCTKRELYYRDVELFDSQDSVNKVIDLLCSMLNVQEYELGVLSSSKGLVAGFLVIHIDDERIDCSTPQAVPQNPSAITSFESTADFILVVEKDTVFQRLVNDNIFSRMNQKIVLVTAKGYPDVNTRVLLKKMSTLMKKPIYILVDADPHGIEIMFTYKYGSLMKLHNSANLAVPKIEWIGICPSDIDKLDINHINLTEADLKKVDELLERPYMNPFLKRELNIFKDRQLKAEIEAVYSFSIDFLINEFIPRKINLIRFPLP